MDPRIPQTSVDSDLSTPGLGTATSYLIEITSGQGFSEEKGTIPPHTDSP
jgi:hypothetical protein